MVESWAGARGWRGRMPQLVDATRCRVAAVLRETSSLRTLQAPKERRSLDAQLEGEGNAWYGFPWRCCGMQGDDRLGGYRPQPVQRDVAVTRLGTDPVAGPPTRGEGNAK